MTSVYVRLADVNTLKLKTFIKLFGFPIKIAMCVPQRRGQ